MDTKIEVETNKLFDELTDFYYPKTECVQQYKQLIKDDLYIYWIDPYELWYYYSIGYLQRFVYNYYDKNKSYDLSTLQKNMNKSLINYGNTLFKYGLDVIRHQSQMLQEYVDKYKPEIYDERTGQNLTYRIEYYWITGGPNPCDFCKSQNGKNIVNVNVEKAHWNCRCQILQKEWYEDRHGKKYYENIKTL